ncbi:MAG: ribosome maturation factor RimP [Bacteroidia bacterium]|nr:ribosome maturation factor RimP [Bacteroidia bacterium]
MQQLLKNTKEGTEKSPLLFDSYMDLSEKVRELAQSCLADESQFLVEVIISSKAGPRRVLVILDGDKGVNIGVCAEVSRNLSKALDESDLIDDNYTLEVTTPGLDHPLKLKRQYYKNVGRGFKVHTKDKILIEGTLLEVNDEKIILQQKTKEGKKIELKSMEIPFENIERAFVMVSFK